MTPGSNISQRVYLKIVTDEGIYGLGESTPYPPVTAETIDGVIAAIEFMKPALQIADIAKNTASPAWLGASPSPSWPSPQPRLLCLQRTM